MRISTVKNYKIQNFRALEVAQNKKNTIEKALEQLEKIEFEKNDLLYINSLGAKPVFQSGKEALDYIKNNDIKIRYSHFAMSDVHARWDFKDNTIHINEKYKNLDSFAGILAVSEAIFHEAGHAKDNDDDNSLQEELDCLSLNVLGHRYNKKSYKDVFLGQNSEIFSQGVSLYEKLFFEFDPQKTALKKRINEKYGFLKTESIGHKATKFSENIKKYSQINKQA